MSGILTQSSTSGIVGQGGSGWVTIAKVDIAQSAPAYDNILSATVAPDSVYKFVFSSVNDTSGTSGYSMYVRGSIDGGSNWLEADYSSEFTYGSIGATQNTGRWNMHSTANANGIGLDHNHQVGVGTSGELNLSTNAATDGSIKAWGHTVYDSDNQGEFGNNQIGGHWNSSSLVNLNYIRLVSSHTNFTPDTGYVYILKLNN